jgi:outer membrane protein assembly factor BamB
MPRGRFNPPPNWPVPHGWTPPPDWEPDPSWPPAPRGWQFWIDNEPPQFWGGDDDEEPRGAAGAHPTRRTGLLAAAAVLVIALVAGTVAAVVWWTHSGGEPPRPDWMLAGTYPSRPDFAWSTAARALDSGACPSISTPIFTRSGFPTPGALVIGQHVLIHVGLSPLSEDCTEAMQQTHLESVNLSTGRLEWAAPSTTMTAGCARTLLANALPCIKGRQEATDQSDIIFIDVTNGAVTSTVHLPFDATMVATDGRSLYTSGYDTQAITVTKGTPDNPLADWKTTIPDGDCASAPMGEAFDLHVGHGLVWGYEKLGAHVLLHDHDGTPVADHGVAAVSVAEDGSWITAAHCQAGVDKSQWQTEVIDGQGHPLFTSPGPLQQHSLAVYGGGPPPFLTTAGDALDPSTGEKRWHIAVSTDMYHSMQSFLVGNVLMAQGADGASAYDLRTGQQLWHNPTAITGSAGDDDGMLTDGSHLLVVDNQSQGAIDALNIADGSQVWTTRGTHVHGWIFATDEGLLVADDVTIGLLRPTGPPAEVPAIAGTNENNRDGGGTKLVTKCGRTPEFQPETIRADSGALVIRMKIVAHCPGGDVLTSAATRITVTSNGQNVASGMFDLSSQPIVIPPGSGGNDSEPAVEHDFRFPPGSFWRLPVSTHEAPTNGSSQQGDVDIDAKTLVVDCDQSGSTKSSAQSSNASQSSTATGPADPKSGDNESASVDALRAIANADRPFVQGQLADRWVPQLSSKRPGLVADGITWNNAETLREHLQLRLAYPEVRLLWSGDWSTFSAADFWVTIAGVTFPDANGALGWCRSHNLDRDHCYAKLVSTTHPIDGSTAFNP